MLIFLTSHNAKDRPRLNQLRTKRSPLLLWFASTASVYQFGGGVDGGVSGHNMLRRMFLRIALCASRRRQKVSYGHLAAFEWRCRTIVKRNLPFVSWRGPNQSVSNSLYCVIGGHNPIPLRWRPATSRLSTCSLEDSRRLLDGALIEFGMRGWDMSVSSDVRFQGGNYHESPSLVVNPTRGRSLVKKTVVTETA